VDDPTTCPKCGKQNIQRMGAHFRFCKGAQVEAAPLPPPPVPAPAPARALDNPLPKPVKEPGRLKRFTSHFKETMADKFEQTAIVAQLLVAALIVAAFMGGVIHLSGAVLVEQPFFWLAFVFGALLLVMRKDVGFNLKYFVLNKLKRNPRIIYHVDGSKVLSRMVVGYTPSVSSFKIGGKPPLEVEVTPDGLLTDNNYSMPCGIHVGGERSLRNLFAQASDYFTAKQVDLMIKDAEQLGELKSTEKLDKLIMIGYIVAGAAVVGVVVSILSWAAIGDLTTAWAAVAPRLDSIATMLSSNFRGV